MSAWCHHCVLGVWPVSGTIWETSYLQRPELTLLLPHLTLLSLRKPEDWAPVTHAFSSSSGFLTAMWLGEPSHTEWTSPAKPSAFHWPQQRFPAPLRSLSLGKPLPLCGLSKKGSWNTWHPSSFMTKEGTQSDASHEALEEQELLPLASFGSSSGSLIY